MKVPLALTMLAVGACSPKATTPVFKQKISCGFDSAGALMIEPAIGASLAVPSEARNPTGFDIDGTIVADKFTGKVSKLRGASSDTIFSEDVAGSYDQASKSLSLHLKYDSLHLTVWPKPDLPDAHSSRAFAAGEQKSGETVHYFTGACGMS